MSEIASTLDKLSAELCQLATEAESRLSKKQQHEIAERIHPLIGPGEWQPTIEQMQNMSYEQLTNRAAQRIARMQMAISICWEYLGEQA